MAVLHKKEEKIQAVLGRLPKKYTNEEFVAMFIKLYSKDWGKIKSAYIKQSQDKEPGTIINMPKPDLYLKQVLETYLKNNVAIVEVKEEPIVAAKAPKIVKEKAAVKKKEVIKENITEEEATATVKKAKAPAKKKVVEDEATSKPQKAEKVKKEKK
ncbi:hypothetical protein [Pedobacter frigiditerrae]|uniref:hypothetical protein n=1 Tax=Pedobacter frigiditerrae TaxID=2530452 RepID=UPI00292D82C9|nr:hypothetical protein [Pedobacter frigiditerrae]